MTSRPIWTGAITFGLVNIPVKLHTAVREEPVRFHMLHDQDGSRLRRKLVCASDGKEVHPEHIVKGYEIGPDQYVVVRQEELDAIAPKKSRTIEIRDFVDEAEIDPLFYDRPYYVVPQEHGAKAYRLLLEAMQKAKRVGIAQFVMRNKEYLAALRADDGVLVLETMHFGSEVLPRDKLEGVPVRAKTDDREVKVAQQLIESLATKFQPNRYRDEYRDNVLELVERKAKGEQVITQPPAAETPRQTPNLLTALEESLARAKGQQQRQQHGSSHGRSTSRRRKSD